jgi:hypothetical protein
LIDMMHSSGLVPFTAPLTADHMRVRYAALQASGAHVPSEILSQIGRVEQDNVAELTEIHEVLTKIEDDTKPCKTVPIRNPAPQGRSCCGGFLAATYKRPVHSFEAERQLHIDTARGRVIRYRKVAEPAEPGPARATYAPAVKSRGGFMARVLSSILGC